MGRPLLAVCILFVTVISFCVSRGQPRQEYPREIYEKEVLVTGTVYRKEIDKFCLESVSIQFQAADSQQTISLQNNLICEYDGAGPKIGSALVLCGRLEKFKEATNPGEFDSAEYYASQKIEGKLRTYTLLETSSEYSRWRESLFLLREYFRERLYLVFPKKEASVLTAMLLGDKSNLDPEIKDLYQENGIIHILSISGLHITMIGMGIYRLLRRLGLGSWLAAPGGAAVLLLYGVMTGMSVSAARAIGMYLIRMLGILVGRTYDMLTAMGILSVILVAGNLLQVKNAGFLLSFGAIAGIGLLCPILEREGKERIEKRYIANPLLRRLREMAAYLGNGLEQSFISGLSVTLMTLPIQLWFYYEVPVYSVVINLLVLPFMSLVMGAGLLAMLVPGFGIVGTVDCIILAGYERLCRAFGALPFSVWNPGRPKVWQMIVYYGVLAAILFWAVRRRVRENERESMLLGERGNSRDTKAEKNPVRRKLSGSRIILITILTILVIVFAIDFNRKTKVTFLDVGQGDCICVELASGEVYLFDCGSTSRSNVGEYVLKPYLKYNGITHVDAVFVSHFDQDHVNGVEEFLENRKDWGITLGQLVVTEAEEVIAKMGAEVMGESRLLEISHGEEWHVGENHFVCLHPPKEEVFEDANAASQCFYIELEGGVTLLLTGDVEGAGEAMLLEELKKRGIEQVTLLKAAHHGSKNSSGSLFLEQVRPQVTVISCGKENAYGHPHVETLKRLEDAGSEILTTPDWGAVTVQLGKQTTIRGFSR